MNAFSPDQQEVLKKARAEIAAQETSLLNESEAMPGEKERIAYQNMLRRKAKSIFMELSGLEFWGSSAEKIQHAVTKGQADLHALKNQYAHNTTAYHAAQVALNKNCSDAETSVKAWEVEHTVYKCPKVDAGVKAKDVQQLLQADPLWAYKQGNKTSPLEPINQDMPPELKAEMATALQGTMEDVKLISTGVRLVEKIVVEGAKIAFCGSPGSPQRENCKCAAKLTAEAGKAVLETTGLKEPVKNVLETWNSLDGSSVAALLASYGVPEEKAKPLAEEYASNVKHLALLAVPTGAVCMAAKKAASSAGKTALRSTEEVIVEAALPGVTNGAKSSGAVITSVGKEHFNAFKPVKEVHTQELTNVPRPQTVQASTAALRVQRRPVEAAHVRETVLALPKISLPSGFAPHFNKFRSVCQGHRFSITKIGETGQGSVRGVLPYQVVDGDLFVVLHTRKFPWPSHVKEMAQPSSRNLIEATALTLEERLQGIVKGVQELALEKGCQRTFIAYDPSKRSLISALESVGSSTIEGVGEFSVGAAQQPYVLLQIN